MSLQSTRDSWPRLLAILILAAGLAPPSHAIDATWVTNAEGNWNNGANWSTNPLFPNSTAYTVFVGSGVAEVNGDFSIGQLNWTGGALSGPAVGTSLLTIDFDSTISGAADKRFAVTNLHFKGGVAWSAGAIRSYEPHGEGGAATISGEFDMQFDGGWTWIAEAIPVITVDEDGSFLKTGGEGVGLMQGLFHNDGLVHVQVGQLNLEGGGTSSGTFLVDEGAVLQFGDFFQNYSNAGAETTTLDVDSVIDADEGGAVRFAHTEFGDTRTDAYGTIDATTLEADPGETGIVLFHEGSALGETTPGSFTATSGATAFDGIAPKIVDLVINDADVALVNGAAATVYGAVNVNEGGVLNLGDAMSLGAVTLIDSAEQLMTGAGEIVMFEGSVIQAHHSLVVDSELTVRGRGTIRGGSQGGRILGTVSADSAGGILLLLDLTIAAGGVAEATAGGTLYLSGSWDNNGVVPVADGSQVILGGTFDTPDIGVIQRTGTTVVKLSGILQNAGQTLNLQNSTGTLTMLGGQIVGGRIAAGGAATLVIDPGFSVNPTVLDGVTLAANITFGSGLGGTLNIENSLALDGASINMTTLNGNRRLSFNGSGGQLLGGTGEIVMAGNNGMRIGQEGGTLTIGPGVTVRGAGSIHRLIPLGGSILNQGTIRVEGSNATLTLDGVTNAGGLIHATTGNTISIVRESAGEATFVQTAGEMRTAATGRVLAGRGLDIRGGKLTGLGTVYVSVDGGANAFVRTTTGGTIAPGESIGALTIDGRVIFGDGGRLAIELGGASADVLQVIRSEFQAVPGDLDLSSTSDFLDVTVLSPMTATSYLIASYAGVLTGVFNNVTPGFSVTYDTTQKKLFLNAAPRADFDADGDVDAGDFIIWQRGVGTTTGATRLQGDANFDGAVNAADFALWKSQFGTPSSEPMAGAVPEPAGRLLALAAFYGLACGRRSRNRER